MILVSFAFAALGGFYLGRAAGRSSASKRISEALMLQERFAAENWQRGNEQAARRNQHAADLLRILLEGADG